MGHQSYRASGLNLVIAVIVCWNTLYMGQAVDDLSSCLVAERCRDQVRCAIEEL
jgi:TnpA family transposase